MVEALKIGSFNVKFAVRIIGGDIIYIPLKGVIEKPQLYVQ